METSRPRLAQRIYGSSNFSTDMALLTALFALSAFVPAQAGTQVTQAVAGSQVPLSFPEASPSALPDEFLNWSGWGYVPTSDRRVTTPWVGTGNWSAVQASTAKSVQPAIWRVKIVVFERGEIVGTSADGTLQIRSVSLYAGDVRKVQSAIARLAPLVAKATEGAVQLVPEVSVEEEALRTAPGFDYARLTPYLDARVNGGTYEAEDKVYRGPYNSVIALDASPWAVLPTSSLFGTPINVVPLNDGAALASPGTLEKKLYDTWLTQVASRAEALGIASARPVKVEANQITFPGTWTDLTALGDLPTDHLLELIGGTATSSVPTSAALPAISGPQLFKSPNVEVTFASDAEHGQVLNYAEGGPARGGSLGMMAKKAGPIDLSAGSVLTFWAKGSVDQPIAIELTDVAGKKAYACIGRDAPIPFESNPSTPPAELEFPFNADGQWQKMAIDLKVVAATGGLGDIQDLAITVPPNAKVSSRIAVGTIKFSFAEFALTKDGAQTPLGPRVANKDSKDSVERALWASHATPSPDLLKLFEDPTDEVRLNAVAVYAKQHDSSAEPNLINLASRSYNPFVAATAMTALSQLDTETARAALKHIVLVGITDMNKGSAARLLGTTKDTTLIGQLVGLYDNGSVPTRIAAIDALAQIPGDPSSKLRLTFLRHTDPLERERAIQVIDPKDGDAMRQYALWHAVNDPSDAVRAAAYLKLVSAPDAALRTEGFKGIKDDSVGVRLRLLAAFAANPSEDDRAALQSAITDRSARVRSAALAAFAALPKKATTDEITNVLTDRNPLVQLALAQFAKKTGMQLPQETLDLLKNSPDPKVRLELERG